MKGKINSNGGLEIYRKNLYKHQYCPFIIELQSSCGDWCPQFGEPKDSMFLTDNENVLRIQVVICHGRILTFNKFEDER